MTEELLPQNPADSEIVMHELVLPSHTNALDTAFGGTIMSWVDICGAISAQRYTRSIVVTASIDQLDFLAPVRSGDTVRLTARVTYTGNTSLEVRVIVDVLNNFEGTEARAGVAYLTYVAVDDQRKPRKIPPLSLDNEQDRARYEAGKARREHRLAMRKKTASRKIV